MNEPLYLTIALVFAFVLAWYDASTDNDKTIPEAAICLVVGVFWPLTLPIFLLAVFRDWRKKVRAKTSTPPQSTDQA